MAAKTGAQTGLSGDAQIRIALQTMVSNGGTATMANIYDAVESAMGVHSLSSSGKASLRYFVNSVAVGAGFVEPHDPKKPGWHITAEGREYVGAGESAVEEEVIDEAGLPSLAPSNSAMGAAFERYVLQLMRHTYPEYAWYHQGVHKKHERGLDLLATRLRPQSGQPRVIGVQVKHHQKQSSPSEKEWLKFMAGCFSRRVDLGIFVTTGRLSGNQRREAAEAQLVILEGLDEVSRMAAQVGLDPFELSEDKPVPTKKSQKTKK